MQYISDRTGSDWPVGPARGPGLAVSGLVFPALLAAFANGLSLAVQLSVAAAVLALGGHALRRLLRPPVAGLRIDGGQVRVRGSSGARATGALVGPPFVSPFYVGLRWRADDGKLPRSLGIFRGQMSGADFRRLCASLRQQCET